MLQNVPHPIRSTAEALPVNDENSLHRMIAAAWSEKRAIAWICATAILFAMVFVLLRSPVYTARAIVQLSPTQEDTQNASTQVVTMSPTAATDAATFLGSEAFAHKVVLRLGLDKLQKRPWLAEYLEKWRNSDWNNYFPIQYVIPSNEDAATKKLMARLVVKNEPRSNIVSIDYTARSASEAARIANAVVAEFVDARRVQKLAARVEAARTEFNNLRLVYGAQHPNMARAKDSLERAEDALLAEQNREPPNETELAALGYVVTARASTIPSGLGTFNILGIAAVMGLLCGVLYALAKAALKNAPPPGKVLPTK